MMETPAGSKSVSSRVVPRIAALLRVACVAAAAVFILLYLGVAAARLTYPFELEWMEGGSLDHVRRLLAGRPLYVAPSAEFVPFIYTPLYYYLGCLTSRLLGPGLPALRLVSLVCSVGCLAIVCGWVRRETRCWLPAILATGLFAGTYRISGAWMDLARVDSLSLFLLLSGFFLLGSSSSLGSWMAAGVLLWLSFLAKQSALPMVAPAILHAVWRSRRNGLLLVFQFAVLISVTVLVLDGRSDGWFSYYVFRLPAMHQVVIKALEAFWRRDLLGSLPIGVALCAVGLGARLLGDRRGSGGLGLACAAGLLGGSWLMRLNAGGYLNALMPAFALIAIGMGIGISVLFGWAARLEESTRALAHCSLLLACLIQFTTLLYDPREMVPTEADAAAGRQVVSLITAVDGDVFAVTHPYLAAAAGKRGSAHEMAIRDVLRNDSGGAGVLLAEDLRLAIRERRYRAILLDDPPTIPLPDLESIYTARQPLDLPQEVFFTRIGRRTRPEYLLRAD